MNKETRKHIEESVMNKLIYYISQNINEEHIEKAKAEFDNVLIENKYSVEESEFTSWLIWEYMINNESVIDIFMNNTDDLSDDEKCILIALKKSYMSIYEQDKTGSDMRYEDIFTGEVFDISEIPYELENKLIMGRLYELDGCIYMFEDCFVIEAKYKNGIEKSFYNNFEEYKRKDSKIEKLVFLKRGHLFLISIINIIFNVKKEDTDDDRLYVYQSNYAIKDYAIAVEKLGSQDVIEFEDTIGDQRIYILFRDADKIEVVSELVLAKKKMEIESVNERDRSMAKSFVDRLLGDIIVHMGDQLVTMGDL